MLALSPPCTEARPCKDKQTKKAIVCEPERKPSPKEGMKYSTKMLDAHLSKSRNLIDVRDKPTFGDNGIVQGKEPGEY